MVGYVVDYFLAGRSNFSEISAGCLDTWWWRQISGSRCFVPRNDPAHNPPVESQGVLFTLPFFVQIKQTRYNLLISEL